MKARRKVKLIFVLSKVLYGFVVLWYRENYVVFDDIIRTEEQRNAKQWWPRSKNKIYLLENVDNLCPLQTTTVVAFGWFGYIFPIFSLEGFDGRDLIPKNLGRYYTNWRTQIWKRKPILCYSTRQKDKRINYFPIFFLCCIFPILF
jgi:hypothetical protein